MQRANNFDALRLFFASVVVLGHCAGLSSQPALKWMMHVDFARLAVEGFFAMSGYLIAGSYERSPSMRSYLSKRALRIFPAYWATLLLGLMVGMIVSTLPFASFVVSQATWKYILAELTLTGFRHPTLPGVFTKNPGGPEVNGALWTIKVELLFYLLLPGIVALCRRFGKWRVLLPIFVLSFLYRLECMRFNHAALGKQLPGQLCFFVVGIAVYQTSVYFLLHGRLMWTLAVVACAVYLSTGGIAFEAIAVGLITLCFALLFPCFTGLTRYGDFSYGIYVFHYPLVQMFIAVGLFTAHPWAGVGAVFCSVLLLATASWHFVESPSIRIGHKSSEEPAYQGRIARDVTVAALP